MNKLFSILATLVLTTAAGAQTLNVQVGCVTYQFPASQSGEMTYTDGTTLTILNKAFTLSDISSMTVDNSSVTDGTVSVVYSGMSATVTVAGNVAQYLTIEQSGAHVSITQSSDWPRKSPTRSAVPRRSPERVDRSCWRTCDIIARVGAKNHS